MGRGCLIPREKPYLSLDLGLGLWLKLFLWYGAIICHLDHHLNGQRRSLLPTMVEQLRRMVLSTFKDVASLSPSPGLGWVLSEVAERVSLSHTHSNLSSLLSTHRH